MLVQEDGVEETSCERTFCTSVQAVSSLPTGQARTLVDFVSGNVQAAVLAPLSIIPPLAEVSRSNSVRPMPNCIVVCSDGLRDWHEGALMLMVPIQAAPRCKPVLFQVLGLCLEAVAVNGAMAPVVAAATKALLAQLNPTLQQAVQQMQAAGQAPVDLAGPQLVVAAVLRLHSAALRRVPWLETEPPLSGAFHTPCHPAL